MKHSYDICIIGGGILGCMAAREFSRYRVSTLLLEEKEDVCMGITKANSAVIYAGYDHKCKTQKSGMCVRGNAGMEKLCEELDVPFERCGSLMIGFGPKAEEVLKKKLEQGKRNQVPGLELLGREEVCAMEPYLNPDVTMGLYARTTATVNPWELGIAAFENAVENGLEACFGKKVTGIRRKESTEPSFEIEITDVKTGKIEFVCVKGILNCAGIHADEIRNMLLPPRYVIRPTKASFLVFSRYLKQKVNHIVFYEPEEKRKGITLVPTTDGSFLAGGTQENALSRFDTATDREGLEALKQELQYLIPQIDFGELIHNFAGVRPNPWEIDEEEKSIPGFVIDGSQECPGLVSMIGVKTPGLTCSQKLAEYASTMLMDAVGIRPELKADYQPLRKSWKHRIDTLHEGKVICHCGQITEEEIRLAVQSGVHSWEGLKHRFFTGMGRCQGSRCRSKIRNIIKEGQEKKA